MLIKRIVTALVLGVVLLFVVLFLPTLAVGLLLGIVFAAGAWEWAAFAKLPPGLRVTYVLLLLVAMACAPWWMPMETVMNAVLCAALLWWLVAVVVLFAFPTRKLPLQFVALAGFFALLPAWAALVCLHGSGINGPGLTLAVFLIVWAADVGAYFSGRTLGRTKLAPRVSPGKTWEGVVGGLLLAGIVAAAAGYWLGVGMFEFALLGIVTAVVSVLGDLTVSLCKRNVGLKDSGTLLPGHGGVMDRIDSLSAAAPAFLVLFSVASLAG